MLCEVHKPKNCDGFVYEKGNKKQKKNEKWLIEPRESENC